jgi:dCMP deaminase
MSSSERWDQKFMGLARHIAGWSKDQSRGIGCVIVGPSHEIRATGYNGFPRGADDSVQARHERPAKYGWSEHAERNAVFNAARVGTPLEGCTAYSTLFPCDDCARALVQSGIKRLVSVAPDFNDPTYGEIFRTSVLILEEGGVQLDDIDNLKAGNTPS